MADETKETTKTKRGRSKADATEADTTKTPADNADFGAADGKDERPVLFFSHGLECERLPPIGDQNWIGRLADVAFWSGHFNATPAQIAIRILVGDSLGLKPAQSLFDLNVTDEGSVTWRQAGGYQNSADAIAADNAAAAAMLDDNDRSGVPARSNVLSMPYGPGSAAAAEFDQNANKGPLTETADETALPGPQSGNGDPGPISGETATESASIPGNDPEPATYSGPEADIERDFPGSGIPDSTPADPFTSTADNAGAGVVSGSNAAVGLDPDATVAFWRSSIADLLADLGFGLPKRTEKLAEFDGHTLDRKKTMFEQCQKMHAERLEGKVDEVRRVLAADNKPDGESRKGFYFYADVPEDDSTWTYAHALKAWAALEKDFPELIAKANAEASAA